MAKLTANGVTIEGTPEELAAIMVRFTVETDVVEAEEVAEDDSLKVGDYARISGDARNIQKLNANDLVEIRKTANAYDFRVYRVTDNVSELFNRHDLIRVSDEEVSAFKAQVEADATERKKTAVFTDAGRKPNEYREGDIVRVSTRADAHKVAGKLVTIAEFRDTKTCGGLAWFEDYGHSITGQYLEPIAFVENRLDRN